MTKIVWVALYASACGGQTPEAREPVPVGEGESRSPGALSPEEWEQVDTTIRRKVRVVNTSCYDPELNRLHDRKFYGNVTLNIHIAPGGRATDVEVKESNFPEEYVESAQTVGQCLADLIKRWDFPVANADAWFLYTFHFEPQY